jgi:hypothetical protein
MFGNKVPQIPTDMLGFRKSSYSDGGGNCVEVAQVRITVHVKDAPMTSFALYALRDSKDPAGPIQWYTVDEWVAFKQGIKAGEFE